MKSCEGTLKKRGHCLLVKERDARALLAAATINGKLSVRRTPPDQIASQAQPRAVLRIANRGNNQNDSDLEPFLRDLQDDVQRLSRAFVRETRALVRSEAEIRSRIENLSNTNPTPSRDRTQEFEMESPANAQVHQTSNDSPLSRSARRRLRQRLRAVLNGPAAAEAVLQEPPGDVAAPSPPAPAAPAAPSSSGPSQAANGTRNKKKRRHRR